MNAGAGSVIGNLRGDPRVQAGEGSDPAEQGRAKRCAAGRIAVETPRDTARFGTVFDGGDTQATGRTIGITLAAGLAER
ncbi:hypothetical protein GCM10012289_34290 [Nonomuraea cavernae]|uniref:Uncharacterized protein n=1 Tax=Nonomuraea cavernae TaxID=2045107 RepID=A0A917YZH2_9ACTN|nr:hypothetical protein GCM10012289_34290 [Nonomuraea cavernae]